MENRIKLLRKQHGYTQDALAKKLNVKQNTISNWESGKTEVDNESTFVLCELFDVSTDYLLGRTDEKKPYPKSVLLQKKEAASDTIEVEPEAIETADDIVEHSPKSSFTVDSAPISKKSTTKAPFPNLLKLPEDFTPIGALPLSPIEYAIPIVGVVRAGIGGAAHEDIEGYEAISKLDLNGHDTSEYFWLRVKGDSMEPELFEGDLVLVHKQTSVDSGTLAVILVDDIADSEGLVKVVNYGHDWIELESYNEAYPPRRFEKQELLRIYVVGQVVQSKRIYSRVNRYKAKI